MVSNIRGGKQSIQQQEPQQQFYQQTFAGQADSSAAAAAAEPSAYWGAVVGAGSQDNYQQQQGQIPNNAAGGGPPAAAPGPPPLLNFRSDKAFMTADEVERRQRAQAELQKELDQQIQEKKRRKVCTVHIGTRKEQAAGIPAAMVMSQQLAIPDCSYCVLFH